MTGLHLGIIYSLIGASTVHGIVFIKNLMEDQQGYRNTITFRMMQVGQIDFIPII